MALKQFKYPLDRTGNSPDNFVAAEPHIVPRDKSRVFAPMYGPFFTDSLVVRQRGNVTPLKVNVDYKAINLYQDATVDLGLSVSAAVILINTSLGSNVEIDYQVVGGPFSLSSDAIQDNFDALELDTRKVAWNDILGKPVRFPPSPHLHDADDLYGMEFLYDALEDVRLAILSGDVASHELIYDYIDRMRDLIYIDFDKLGARVDALTVRVEVLERALNDIITGPIKDLQDQLTAHIQDKNNPHGTTKTHVGLSNVQNFPIATNIQAQDENNSTAYVVPSSMWSAIKAKVYPLINNHIADKNNPHATTKTHVGLSDVQNFPMATNPEAIAHTAADRYMSPLRVWELIQATVQQDVNLVANNLASHINNYGNPHRVNKWTVELGNVDNFRTANGEEAKNPNIWDAFVTPGGLWSAIRSQSSGNVLDPNGGSWMDPSTGFLIQWGAFAGTYAEIAETVPFRRAFPNACTAFVATIELIGGTESTYNLRVVTRATTYASVYHGNNERNFTWIAMGY